LSANNCVNSCLFLESGIPVISSFCLLVIPMTYALMFFKKSCLCGDEILFTLSL
jgi:hypothetical protein